MVFGREAWNWKPGLFVDLLAVLLRNPFAHDLPMDRRLVIKMNPLRHGRNTCHVAQEQQIPTRRREIRILGYSHVEMTDVSLADGQVDETLRRVIRMSDGHRPDQVRPFD